MRSGARWLQSRAEEAIALLRGKEPRRVWSGQQSGSPRIAFMFPGQGAQHPAMGAELYGYAPVFREEIDKACETLRPHLGFDLRSLLLRQPGDESTPAAAERLNQTIVTQPALFVVEHALARQWMAWGFAPEAMIGHSVGEYVAATLAGSVQRRRCPGSRCRARPPDHGIARRRDAVGKASGSRVAALARQCRIHCGGKRTSALHGRGPTRLHRHSGDDAGCPVRSRETAQDLPRLSFRDDGSHPRGVEARVRHTVRFFQGAQELLRPGDRILIEAGPGRSLSTLARQNGAKSALPSMADAGERAAALEALAHLWLTGASLRTGRPCITVRCATALAWSTYPFERKRLWLNRLPWNRPPW